MILILFSGIAQAQVGIGTTTPDASAALDITNTGKGMLIPRLTSAQRTGISSPATGLLVYQTDGTPGFYYNSGTSGSPVWTFIQNSSSGTVPTARLGTGTASSSTFLRGDGTWAMPSANHLNSIVLKTSDYTVTTSDEFVYTTSANITFTLPSAASAGSGKLIYLMAANTGMQTAAATGDALLVSYNTGTYTNTNTINASGFGGFIWISDGVSKWLAVLAY